jgi:hypothetical protein
MSSFFDMFHELRDFLVWQVDRFSLQQWAIIAGCLLVVGIFCMRGLANCRL